MVELRSGKRVSVQDNVQAGGSRAGNNNSGQQSTATQRNAQARSGTAHSNSSEITSKELEGCHNEPSEPQSDASSEWEDVDTEDEDRPGSKITSKEPEGYHTEPSEPQSDGSEWEDIDTEDKKRPSTNAFSTSAMESAIAEIRGGRAGKTDRPSTPPPQFPPRRPLPPDAPSTTPLDRRPSPGRIVNAREANELGAAPVPSRGDPAEWPNVRDADYSNLSDIRWSPTRGAVREGRARRVDAPPRRIGRRKNPAYERWEEERPLRDEDYLFHCIYLCVARGPREMPPTWDRAGYRLDWRKCEQWIRPTGKPVNRSWWQEEMVMMEREAVEERAMEIFFEPGAAPSKDEVSPVHWWLWEDRVSKDLGVPFHEVGLEEFEEWERRGFQKAKAGEYMKYSNEQMERVSNLASGSALRKGGCRTKI
ncbi:nardilysin isoform 2 [Diplodia corticola]|uniref:Nardilysin isoform 2 n=1 Tax=Diplodia corticola TaxID=236234 RepID=A0A1J9SGR4_9PEZI|nr:nardilysin isoform 2 [Diplodia corticola]OJD38773.1 nardilysin isoform 2 [Diplodia corticola]